MTMQLYEKVLSFPLSVDGNQYLIITSRMLVQNCDNARVLLPPGGTAVYLRNSLQLTT